jgi:hypothetical protein
MTTDTLNTTTPALTAAQAAAERELLVTNLYLAALDRLPGDEWWDALLGRRKLCDVPNTELVGIVANLEAAKRQDKPAIPDATDDERELLITNLFVAAYPFPKKGWLRELLGGRKLRDVRNAELSGIVARLEAQAA